MSVFEALISGMAAHGLHGLDDASGRAIVDYVRTNEPGKIDLLDATALSNDDQRLREEIVGTLRVVAASGTVAVDDALLIAIRLVTFDHREGRINIDGVMIEVPELVTQGPGAAERTTAVAGENKYRSLKSDMDMERGVGTATSDEQSNL